jgi:hypothetical protein
LSIIRLQWFSKQEKKLRGQVTSSNLVIPSSRKRGRPSGRKNSKKRVIL